MFDQFKGMCSDDVVLLGGQQPSPFYFFSFSFFNEDVFFILWTHLRLWQLGGHISQILPTKSIYNAKHLRNFASVNTTSCLSVVCVLVCVCDNNNSYNFAISLQNLVGTIYWAYHWLQVIPFWNKSGNI